MKSRNVHFIALILGVLTASCIGEDLPEREDTTGTIGFNAIVPKAPRAESTTTATIKEFTVYAFTGGKPYMQNVHVTRSGSSWTYSPVAYWPSTPVNFYAFSPNITNSPSTGTPGLGTIPGYNSNGATDLLYAVNMDESPDGTPVNLNFRHALTRVSAMLSSSNPAITVHVHYVKLYNIYHQGTFDFPQATTSPEQPGNVGSWSDLTLNSDQLIFYPIDDSDIIDLTSTPVDITENNLNASFFIPQPLTQLGFDGTKYTGNGIEVDCELFDTATGTKIWPNASTPPAQLVQDSPAGRLFFPVTTTSVTEWKIGHAYVYNIKIDNPDVLKPIIFDVNVEEMQLEQ